MVGVFYQFYVVPTQAEMATRETTLDRTPRRHRQGFVDRRAAEPVPAAGRRARRTSRKPEGRAARAEGRGRFAAPHSDARDAVESRHSRIQTGAVGHQAAARRVAHQAPARRHVSQPRDVLRSRQQVLANHQRERHHAFTGRRSRRPIRRLPSTAPRRPSCCSRRPSRRQGRRTDETAHRHTSSCSQRMLALSGAWLVHAQGAPVTPPAGPPRRHTTRRHAAGTRRRRQRSRRRPKRIRTTRPGGGIRS